MVFNMLFKINTHLYNHVNIQMMSLVRTDLFEVLKIPIIGKFGIIFNNKLRKTVKDRQGIRRMFFLN
jgi:hypothetical protein